jgi:ABC-type glycerol-3-phosphate transport system permease component
VNGVRLTILTAAALFVVLLPLSRRLAMRYARLALVIGVCTVMMLPFVWLICAAFKDKAVINDYTFLPPPGAISSKTINFNNFRTLFAPTQTLQGEVTFWRYVCNSIILAGGGTFISMVFSSMGGFALAKYRFAGRGGILTFMLASMTIPGIVLLAPSFEVIWRLGWMDSYRALLVPGAVSVFGIFLFRQAMLGVPDDLLEAGRIDGCGEFRIYLTLVMPLVRPMTGAYCLISFLASWNAFIAPNVFLQSQAKLTLPVVLNQYINVYQQQYGVFLAGTLLAIALPAALFLALQREFIAGLTSGALKQ